MALTPDRKPGPLVEDESVELTPQALSPTADGEIRYVLGLGFRFFEEGVDVGLSGAGITEPQHENLDTLVHNLSETSYEEITRDGSGRTQDYTVWTTSGKTIKVRELNLTRDGSGRVSVIVLKQYDGTGTLVQTLTKTMSRDANGSFASFAVVET